MRRFRFSLAKIERLRSHKERVARRVLAERVAALAGLEDEMAVVDANLELCDQEGGPLADALGRGLSRRRVALEAARGEALAELELARETWLSSRRERLALTRLRERRLAEWRAGADREERAVMDEVAGIRHARRTAGRDA